MIRKWPMVIFLSDTHGGGGGNADDLTKWSWLLRELLRECVVAQTATCMVGDIFEHWQYRPDQILRVHGQTFEPIGDLIDQKLFHYCPGNHDLEAGSIVLLSCGGWVSNHVIVNTGHGKFWGEHGHRLDPHNRKPGWTHRLLLSGTKRLEHIWPNIDVIDRRREAHRRAPKDERATRYAEGALEILNQGQVDGVIFGHTHRRGLWSLETRFGPRPYGNTGAWTNAHEPSVVVVRGGGMRSVTLSGLQDLSKIWG